MPLTEVSGIFHGYPESARCAIRHCKQPLLNCIAAIPRLSPDDQPCQETGTTATSNSAQAIMPQAMMP